VRLTPEPNVQQQKGEASGPMFEEHPDFATTIAQQKKLLADLLMQANRTETYPASLTQQRLWFLDQLQGRNSAYNVYLGLWLRGPLDLNSLQSSLQEIVKRHDSFRTEFRLEGDELLQVVTQNCTADLSVTDVTNAPDPYGEAYRLASQDVAEPFDLSQAPLFRARVFRVTPEDHVFLCTMHHIVTDAWSMQIFAKELTVLYEALSNGRPAALLELPIRYGDYAEWQREWFGTEALQQQLAYWKNKLKSAPAVLELPKDGPRPLEQTFDGASQTVPLSGDLVSRINTVAARYQATPFMLLLAAFKVLLYRYSREPDVVVGVPVAGRNRVETEGLIGFFVNTLVLRDDLSGNPKFADVLTQVRETTLGAFANADVPFETIVETLQPERNLSHNPIFQVMFASIKSAVRSHEFGNLTAFPYVVDISRSIFDLTMTLIQGVDEQWWAQIEYNTKLFQYGRIRQMFGDYITILGAVTGNPEAHILNLRGLSVPDVNDVAKYLLSAKSDATVNQGALPPAPAADTRTEQLPQPAAAELKLLVEVWKRVLGRPNVGIHDNFFDVGGHSLLAARLILQIRNLTGRDIPVSAIFRAPTIESFARLLQQDSVSKTDPVVMQLHDGHGVIPFFAVAAPGVDTTGLALLARQMGKDQSMYKLQPPAPIVWGRPFTKKELRELAQDCIAAMRSVQPQGPYCLGGMCEGVLIAQQMIIELESQGEEVGLFAIFDTWVLENSQIRPLWAIDYYLQRFRIFRSQPSQEQQARLRRIFKRLLRPNQVSDGSGWTTAYWPSEKFQPPRFRAPVLLFKRLRQPYYYVRDREMGWGTRSEGGVEICEISCQHIEVLRLPHVQIIGQKLASRLQRIRDRQMQSNSVATPKAGHATQ
jgi:thioesterase domain-containing protein